MNEKIFVGMYFIKHPEPGSAGKEAGRIIGYSLRGVYRLQYADSKGTFLDLYKLRKEESMAEQDWSFYESLDEWKKALATAEDENSLERLIQLTDC